MKCIAMVSAPQLNEPFPIFRGVHYRLDIFSAIINSIFWGEGLSCLGIRTQNCCHVSSFSKSYYSTLCLGFQLILLFGSQMSSSPQSHRTSTYSWWIGRICWSCSHGKRQGSVFHSRCCIRLHMLRSWCHSSWITHMGVLL